MKIFFASQSFYPYIGGVSTYLLNLAKGLMQRGNEVKVFHLRPPKESSEETIQEIKVFRLPKEPIVAELLKGYSNFKERIYRECHGEGDLFEKEPLITYGYDEYHNINQIIGKEIEGLLEENPAEIVHVHDFQLLLIYKNIPRGIPAILTWHIPFIDSISWHLKEFLVKHMKEFDKVIFSAGQYADSAVKAGIPASKIMIIHPIANTSLFKPMKKEGIKNPYNVPGDFKIILCAQRIDLKSGHMQLVNAMPKVIKKLKNVKLVFVGTSSMTNKISSERDKIEREVHDAVKRLNIVEHVVFAGNVEYEKMPIYYNAADIVALMSKSEAFGLAITEAMACGKPVIGTRVPGIELQIRDCVNGFLVNVNDIDKTSEKLIEMLMDRDLRERMGAEGLKIVKSQFSMMKGIDAHHGLYKKLLKEKSDWRLEKIKLDDVSAIVTDFDRTITSKQDLLDELVIDGLVTLKKPLILATGRSIVYAKNLYKKYPIWECIIAENGGCIYLPKVGTIISCSSDKFQEARAVVEKSSLPANYGSTIMSMPKILSSILKKALGEISQHLEFRENVNEIMTMPKGVDKGSSLRVALNYLNLDPEKIVIIADGENDIDLFKLPGFKIAVANASNKLKLLADEVTKKESENGVLEVIDKLRM